MVHNWGFEPVASEFDRQILCPPRYIAEFRVLRWFVTTYPSYRPCPLGDLTYSDYRVRFEGKHCEVHLFDAQAVVLENKPPFAFANLLVRCFDG